MTPKTICVFGDYRLDAGRRLLSHRSAGPIPVTSRVFDTLLHLVQNPCQLVGKRELMNAVWGNTVVEENNLTQAISTLRHVLGERPDEHRYIVTVPGRGYRFIADVVRAGQPPLPSSVAAPGAETTDAPAPPPTIADARRAEITGKRPIRRWLLIAAIAIAALTALAAVTRLYTAWKPAAPPIKTIAVLPFKPLVPETSDPALELGMADS